MKEGARRVKARLLQAREEMKPAQPGCRRQQRGRECVCVLKGGWWKKELASEAAHHNEVLPRSLPGEGERARYAASCRSSPRRWQQKGG